MLKLNIEANSIFVSVIVFLELPWVLLKCYDWRIEKFCEAIEDILSCPSFNIEHQLFVKLAISRCRKGQDFSDVLIGQIGALKNCKTYTLNKKLN